jgi:hypothetical protein
MFGFVGAIGADKGMICGVTVDKMFGCVVLSRVGRVGGRVDTGVGAPDKTSRVVKSAEVSAVRVLGSGGSAGCPAGTGVIELVGASNVGVVSVMFAGSVPSGWKFMAAATSSSAALASVSADVFSALYRLAAALLYREIFTNRSVTSL